MFNAQSIRLLKGIQAVEKLLSDKEDCADGPPFDLRWLLETMMANFNEGKGRHALELLEAAVSPDAVFVTPSLDDEVEVAFHVSKVPDHPVLLSYAELVLVKVGDNLIVERETLANLHQIGVETILDEVIKDDEPTLVDSKGVFFHSNPLSS